MSTYVIKGADRFMEILKEYPEMGYKRPVMIGFRKAALPVKKAMISNLPSYIKDLKKYIKIKQGKGKSLTMSVGSFGRQTVYQNSKGQEWDPYQLFYWHNYGTLARRDPGHFFQNSRRKTSRGWKGGITPRLFFEKAWEQSKAEAQKAFEKSVDEQVTKWLNNKAYTR
jgi:hypothetical protein